MAAQALVEDEQAVITAHPTATTPEVLQATPCNTAPPIASCLRTSHTKQRRSVAFAKGSVRCDTEDGHPDYRGPAMRVRTLRHLNVPGEPLTKRNVLALEAELGAEYQPSIDRLKRRSGITPPIKRVLPFAGQPAKPPAKRARALTPTGEQGEENVDCDEGDGKEGEDPEEPALLVGFHPYTGGCLRTTKRRRGRL